MTLYYIPYFAANYLNTSMSLLFIMVLLRCYFLHEMLLSNFVHLPI